LDEDWIRLYIVFCKKKNNMEFLMDPKCTIDKRFINGG
jgi:hypothetical protein